MKNLFLLIILFLTYVANSQNNSSLAENYFREGEYKKASQLFIELIEAHKQAQEDFNQKWQISSDCETPNQPTEVLCDDGVPKFVY